MVRETGCNALRRALRLISVVGVMFGPCARRNAITMEGNSRSSGWEEWTGAM
jgi:hypothetical protein